MSGGCIMPKKTAGLAKDPEALPTVHAHAAGLEGHTAHITGAGIGS